MVLTFRLTVTDNEGAEDDDLIAVGVSPRPDLPELILEDGFESAP